MITHVAILYRGEVYSLPAPFRHHDVIKMIALETGETSLGENEQGFLDGLGRFLRRKAAFLEAARCHQLLSRATCPNQRLYSEDVW